MVIRNKAMEVLGSHSTTPVAPTSDHSKDILNRAILSTLVMGRRRSQADGAVSAHQPTITKVGTVDAGPISHLSKQAAA